MFNCIKDFFKRKYIKIRLTEEERIELNNMLNEHDEMQLAYMLKHKAWWKKIGYKYKLCLDESGYKANRITGELEYTRTITEAERQNEIKRLQR